jgi:DNA-binding HxlR family transcriptional regulator
MILAGIPRSDLAMGGTVHENHRSGCPINLMLEVIGDKWSLLVIRDIIFGNRRHFRELLTKSEEGIASNILADRLKRLLQQRIIVKTDDASHRQKAIYSLTERGIELLPVLAEMAAWGSKYLPASRELSIRAQILEEGGPKLWAEFMAELRESHLQLPTPRDTSSRRLKAPRVSVRQKLNSAYGEMMAKRKQR